MSNEANQSQQLEMELPPGVSDIIRGLDDMEHEDDVDENEAFENIDRWTSGADMMNFRVGRAISGLIKDLSVRDVKFDGFDQTRSMTEAEVNERSGSNPSHQTRSMTEAEVNERSGSNPRLENVSQKGSFWDMFSSPVAPPQDGEMDGIPMCHDTGGSTATVSTGTISANSRVPLRPKKNALWEDLDGSAKSSKAGRNGILRGNSEYHRSLREQTARKKRIFLFFSWALIVTLVLFVTTLVKVGTSRIHARTNGHTGDISASGYRSGISRDELFELLASVSPALIREDKTTPQFKAYQWVMQQNLPLSNYRIIQRYILATLYYSTGGDWIVKPGHAHLWLDESDECQWAGLRCINYETNAMTESVTALSLTKLNLVGQIPVEIGELPFLEMLFLNDNLLTGFIPESIVTLTSLRELRLQNNQLSGRIPNYVGNLKRLQRIDLSNNSLIGSIPIGLQKCKLMHYLDLSRNWLSGTIPNSIKALTQLTIFDLAENRLTGSIPNWIGQLTQLYHLSLNENHIWGSIPETIGRMSKLNRLYLASNAIVGEMPDQLGDLTHLQQLDVSGNQLQGHIPHSLTNLKELEVLFLHENSLAGQIPRWLGQTSPIARVTLHKNNFRGQVSDQMCGLGMKILTSDCGGTSPIVRCSCCTECWVNH